ncbi:MAG TPA: hypothetical protein VF246_05685 [Acidimicrobiia bacterium]
MRPTARVRPTVPTRLLDPAGPIHPSDPYVRRFWVAALGPTTIAELLRLMRAADRGDEVRLPRNLPALLRTGLVRVVDGCLGVASMLPPVPEELRWRFPPDLAAEHRRWMAGAN